METPDTTDRILDAAQDLVQTCGFNAFSYRDVAEKIHIRTASIHYHFPKKDDLALALIRRYHEQFVDTLRQIGQRESRPEYRLAAYMGLFSDLSSRGNVSACSPSFRPMRRPCPKTSRRKSGRSTTRTSTGLQASSKGAVRRVRSPFRGRPRKWPGGSSPCWKGKSSFDGRFDKRPPFPFRRSFGRSCPGRKKVRRATPADRNRNKQEINRKIQEN